MLFPAAIAGVATGGAVVLAVVGKLGVAALTFGAGIAGRRCVEFGATLVTATGLAPLAPELVVTELTGGAG
jgi:hypothetical protein